VLQGLQGAVSALASTLKGVPSAAPLTGGGAVAGAAGGQTRLQEKTLKVQTKLQEKLAKHANNPLEQQKAQLEAQKELQKLQAEGMRDAQKAQAKAQKDALKAQGKAGMAPTQPMPGQA